MLSPLDRALLAASIVASTTSCAPSASPSAIASTAEHVAAAPAIAGPGDELATSAALAPTSSVQVAVVNQNPVLLYPPTDRRAPRPITFVLHGREMDPEDMCERWSEADRALRDAWLVCPAGNAQEKEAFDWAGSAPERLAAVDALVGEGGASLVGDVVVGFSRGAFLARDWVEARPARFRGMVLLGAAITLSPDGLKRAGVRRVVLGCGDRDEARASMTRTAAKLAAGGLPTRFVSLGPIYHALPVDLEPVLRDALAWARAE